MVSYQYNLEAKLWAIADELRGNMDINEFKNYFLGFVFFKYLSEKLELYLNKELKEEGISFTEAYVSEEYREKLEEKAIKNLGYFLKPEYLFRNIARNMVDAEPTRYSLMRALGEIENSSIGHKSEESFKNIFIDVDLNSSKLGTEEDRNKFIFRTLNYLSERDFRLEIKENTLGKVFEYLISKFASSAGKRAGEFYTPQQVSRILAKIVTMGKEEIKSVYDPACGSCSLILAVSKEAKVSKFNGQELDLTTYNLARMNMIINDVKYEDFDIKQGNSLEDPRHIDMKFEAVVSNPPFSAKWSASGYFLNDKRFSEYGKLAPRSKADYAFVQHMIYHLDKNGTMAVVLPHGVLFRGSIEREIRKYLIEDKNYLDAIIGLPANIFYGTSIPTVILVFKKSREEDANILFIDASKEGERVKNKKMLRDEGVNKIIEAYNKREEIDKFAHVATLDEIRENDHNLNIPRYIDISEEEEPIDLDAINKRLKEIGNEIKENYNEIKKYCDELGIDAPVFVEE